MNREVIAILLIAASGILFFVIMAVVMVRLFKNRKEAKSADEDDKLFRRVSAARELVAPDGVNPNPLSYFLLNDAGHDVYVRCFTIDALPKRTAFATTFPALFNCGRMRVSVFIEPLPESRAAHMLDVKDQIIFEEKEVELSGEDRKNLAWYAMQRIKVRNTEEEQLEKMYLCVNKQGRPLKKQVYRKMLERTSSELDLSRVYNSGYLRSLYGYLEIAYGRKTVEDVAMEYQVEKYYLLNRIFKGMSIEYDSQLLNEVANVDEDD